MDTLALVYRNEMLYTSSVEVHRPVESSACPTPSPLELSGSLISNRVTKSWNSKSFVRDCVLLMGACGGVKVVSGDMDAAWLQSQGQGLCTDASNGARL